MADRPLHLQRDPFNELQLTARFDWRDARVMAWIDKFCEFGWRDSVANVKRQSAINSGRLLRSIKWRTWADSGGDRQVWQAKYMYYAKFVELALGRGNPFRALPPGIAEPRWMPIRMPDRARRAKPSIPTEMRRQADKFTRMLQNRFSYAGLATMVYALGNSVHNRIMIEQLMLKAQGAKIIRQ